MIERIHQLIKHEVEPPSTVITLLENTFIGTQGTLYQLLDTSVKINLLDNPHFIYLERNGKAIGHFTLCQREVTLTNLNSLAFYIRYFAFEQIFQGSSKKSRGKSDLHSYFKAFFNTSNLNPIQPSHERAVYWAYIDPENARSLNMNENFGFQTIGKFNTTAFSRVRPKKFGVERLKLENQMVVLNRLENFYRNYNFFSAANLFKNDDYFVIRENNKIVAGIQANPVCWKIKSLPGIGGKILLKTAPFIPGLRKLINSTNHKFLATEGLFWEDGYEGKVAELLEGVLALTHHHSLLIWCDTKSEILSKISVKWGFIQKTKKDNLVHIVAKFNQYSQLEIENIKNHPCYLSGFDMT